METHEQLIHPLNCMHRNLRKATRVIDRHYSKSLKSTQVERTQITMLFMIRGYQNSTISELAQAMTMDQTTVTRSVQGLVRKGFVQLTKGADKRTRYVQMTDAGNVVLDEATPFWAEAQSDVVNALGEKKATQLLDLLDELVDVIGN